MEQLSISFGGSGFVMLDSISLTCPESMSGTRVFDQAPACLGLEALAQLGALHVRWLTEFKQHAFLMKINSLRMPETAVLNGSYKMTACCIAKSRRAFQYALRSLGDGGVCITGEFIFAVIDYDHHFKQEVLTRHYKRLFKCLQSVSKTA